MTPSKFLTSVLPWVIRTFVPILVAFLVHYVPAALGITEQQLTVGVSTAIAFGYAFLVRLAELYVDPKFGVLLGWASPAVYPSKDVDSV